MLHKFHISVKRSGEGGDLGLTSTTRKIFTRFKNVIITGEKCILSHGTSGFMFISLLKKKI